MDIAEPSPAGTCSTRATSEGVSLAALAAGSTSSTSPVVAARWARRPPAVRPRCRHRSPTNPLVVCSRPPKRAHARPGDRRPTRRCCRVRPGWACRSGPTSIPASARPSGSAPMSRMSCARSTWSMTSCAAPAAQGRAGAGGMPSTRGRYVASTLPAAAGSSPTSRPATWTPPSDPMRPGQGRQLQAQARRLTIDGATRPPRPWPSDQPPARQEVHDRGRCLVGRRRHDRGGAALWRGRGIDDACRRSPPSRPTPARCPGPRGTR